MYHVVATEKTCNARNNGTIEVLRFFFAITIVCTHTRAVADFSYLGGGWFGVEFFFIVVGIFMAQSAQKKIFDKTIDIPQETRKYVIRKVNQFLPQLLIVVLISFSFVFIPSMESLSTEDVIVELLTIVPGIMLTSMAGVTNLCTSIPGVTWYLSAMIIGLAILYPIYLKWNSLSRNVLFPLISVFCLGYIAFTYGNFYYAWEIDNLVRVGLIRAIGEISLGVVLYDVSVSLRNYNYTVIGKILITLIGVLCFIALLLFMQEMIAPPHVAMVFVMAIMVVVVYSGIGFVICNNKYINYLGRSSLYVYLFHMVVINIFIVWAGNDYVYEHGVIVFVIAVVSSMLIFFPIEYFRSNVRMGIIFIKEQKNEE